MNKKKKRILIIGISAVTVTALIAGGVMYSRYSREADVTAVSDLNQQYYDDTSAMDGIVSDAGKQSIYTDSTSVIQQVYVTKGQQVAAGDKLLSYDLSSLQLSVKMKQLEVAQAENDIDKGNHELQTLMNTSPQEPVVVTPTPVPTATPVSDPVQDKDAWSYINSMDQKYSDEASDGTYEHPYRFIVQKDGYVSQAFFTSLAQYTNTWASFEIYTDNTVSEPNIEAVWKLNSASLLEGEDGTEWYVFSHEKKEETDTDGDSTPQETQDSDSSTGYTREELNKMITAKKADLRKLDLDKRKKEQELKVLQEQSTDGNVYAKADGTVTVACTADALPQDGSPVVTVSSGTGSDIQANVSELMLDQVPAGTKVAVQNYTNGNTYEGTVSSISTVPVTDTTSYSSGNTNTSYYSCTIHVDNGEDLKTGDYLSVTLNQSTDTVSDTIYLENAYVRNDNGQYYVMKDKDGKLVRQNVKVGKIVYGSMVQITGGLSTDDYIAFPYGGNSSEGTRTKKSDSSSNGNEGGVLLQ